MKFIEILKSQGTDRGSRTSPVVINIDSIEKIEELYPEKENSYTKITLKGRADYILGPPMQNVLLAMVTYKLASGEPEIMTVDGRA